MPNEIIDDFFIERIIVIVLIVIGGKWLIRKIGARVVAHMEKEGHEGTSASFRDRAKTLAAVISATGNAIIYAIAFFMILNALHVDTTPILTGVGIIGLGVGFGSQALVKDLVSGLFVLLEDQYRIGEWVRIGAVEGSVRKVTMRLTILEGDGGAIHYIPNGTVTGVTNLSRQRKST
ncbi:mechanosensitive ion channel family protein [bacterium]|nr:mechanosensitive ion channel family protein [bacterium]